MERTLRFVIIPKVAHPWFDEVNKGAQAQAKILSRELCVEIVVEHERDYKSVQDPPTNLLFVRFPEHYPTSNESNWKFFYS